MSELGQTRSFADIRRMNALPSKGDLHMGQLQRCAPLVYYFFDLRKQRR